MRMTTETTTATRKRAHWRTAIRSLHPCGESRSWFKNQSHAHTAWETCDRGDWLLWIAARLLTTDKGCKLVVLAACDCAETALVHVPATEERPRKCIETVRAWTRGEATMEQVCEGHRAAADAAYAAYAYADAAYAAYAYADAAGAAAYAAYAYAYAYAAAAAAAAYAAYAYAAYAAAANAYAAYAAAAAANAAAANAAAANAYDARKAHLARLANIVRARIPWETIEPALRDLQRRIRRCDR